MAEEKAAPSVHCAVCGKEFSTEKQLAMHKLSVHREGLLSEHTAVPSDDALNAKIASLEETILHLQASVEQVSQENANNMKATAENILKITNTIGSLAQQTTAAIQQVAQQSQQTTQQIVDANFKALFEKEAHDRTAEGQVSGDGEKPQGQDTGASRLENAIAGVLESIAGFSKSITGADVVKFWEATRPHNSLTDIVNQYTALSRFEKAGGDVNALKALTEGTKQP